MMARVTAEELVRALDLLPHPEGGFYRETYRATTLVTTPRGPRAASTAIYFLVTAGSFSALHRIASDELWHFYRGDPLEIVSLDADGERHDVRLDAGRPQAVVPAGRWFGSRLAPGGRFALVGCTVSPGFDFADFELGTRAELLASFPHHAALVGELTREP
jgi:predicted cupin superfamily sugar epimerase